MVINAAKSSAPSYAFYFCGGSCVEDVTSHLAGHLSLHPTLRTCSADTILRAINELSQENISYTSDVGKSYDFNTADTLNILLLNCLLATGQLKEGEGYDVDFDPANVTARLSCICRRNRRLV